MKYSAMNKFIFLVPMLMMLVSCGIEEQKPYQTPFIHIMENGASATTFSSKGNSPKAYSVYLSSAPLTRKLEVYYEIQLGDGLMEGVDFKRITVSDTLVFLPGIYDMPIRIQWLSHTLDLTKNNTLKIQLLGNNQGITIGMPGPDHYQTSFTITKTL